MADLQCCSLSSKCSCGSELLPRWFMICFSRAKACRCHICISVQFVGLQIGSVAHKDLMSCRVSLAEHRGIRDIQASKYQTVLEEPCTLSEITNHVNGVFK